MRRLQFRLSTLLWITLAVTCWFGGMAWQRRLDLREIESLEKTILQRTTFY